MARVTSGFALMMASVGTLIAQASTDVGGNLGTGLASGGVVAGFGFLMYKALLTSNQEHIETLRTELKFTHEHHGALIEKEAALTASIVQLTLATGAMSDQVGKIWEAHLESGRVKRLPEVRDEVAL